MKGRALPLIWARFNVYVTRDLSYIASILFMGVKLNYATVEIHPRATCKPLSKQYCNVKKAKSIQVSSGNNIVQAQC